MMTDRFRSVASALFAAGAVALVACRAADANARSEAAQSDPTMATAPSTSSAAARGTATTTPSDPARSALHLGAPIESTAPSVRLADLAKNPSAWSGKSFTTEGTVSAVCQNMGCWMEIKDDSSQAHIKMAGHKFFVPKTSAGHHAKVLASLATSNAPTCSDEADCRGKQDAVDPLAHIELVADGVELM